MQKGMFHRYAAECIGTFGIVFPPVALSAAGHIKGADSSLLAAALVSGLAVLAMICTFGAISAAHFNPAVTLGFAAAGRFPFRYVLPYWISQFLGAIAAVGLVSLLFGERSFGAHIPSVEVSRAIGIEATLTFFLMLVIIAVATDKRVSSTTPAIAIGLTVVFDILIGGALTGGSMNPARSLAPALFLGGKALSYVWIYLIAPPLGAVVAARLYELVRLHPEHSKGAPNDLFEALEEISSEAKMPSTAAR